MTKLFYVEASPQKDRSASIAISNVFINAYKKAHPNDQIEKIDLWDLELPEVNGDLLRAKYAVMRGQSHTTEQADAWKEVVMLVERFKSADKFLFSLPMWNFGIPYRLKHFIDVLTQPGLTFSFSPDEGYKGLVTNRPVAIICARGGQYAEGSPMAEFDFQLPYMENWLKFIGFTELWPIAVEPTLAGPDISDLTLKNAGVQAEKIALTF